jgi:hypothetical protein
LGFNNRRRRPPLTPRFFLRRHSHKKTITPKDVDDDGELECVAPEDAEDDFDLCGGDKKGSGNWAVWEDGDAACTCASGFVTAAKIRSKYENSNKLPPAKDLCTVECSGDVECTDGDGPLDCFCLDGDDDEGAAEYVSKKDQAEADKEINDAAKDEYKVRRLLLLNAAFSWGERVAAFLRRRFCVGGSGLHFFPSAPPRRRRSPAKPTPAPFTILTPLTPPP